MALAGIRRHVVQIRAIVKDVLVCSQPTRAGAVLQSTYGLQSTYLGNLRSAVNLPGQLTVCSQLTWATYGVQSTYLCNLQSADNLPGLAPSLLEELGVLCYTSPLEKNQTVFCRPSILPGSHRNPATCGTDQGNYNRRFGVQSTFPGWRSTYPG